MKIRIAKFQGPISPPRYQEPPQIVQEVPPLDLSKLFGDHPACGDFHTDKDLPDHCEGCTLPKDAHSAESQAGAAEFFENEDTSNERR